MMQVEWPRSEEYSPASFAYFLVSDHCLILNIFPLPLKQIPQAQFLRISRPLTLPLHSPVCAPLTFLKQGFSFIFFFPLLRSYALMYTGEILLGGFCLIQPSFFKAVSLYVFYKLLHFNGFTEQLHFCLSNLIVYTNS